jgi:anti-anti-sigma factor
MPPGWRALSAAAAPGSRVIVDLEGLAFIDCSGLSAMVSAWKQARQGGGDLWLAAPQQPVLRLLSLTDLTGLLPVLASVDQAANGDGRSRRPDGWLVTSGTVKHRRETVNFTGWEMTHHRPGRGRLPQAMRMQRGGRHSQQQRQVRRSFRHSAGAANGPVGAPPG